MMFTKTNEWLAVKHLSVFIDVGQSNADLVSAKTIALVLVFGMDIQTMQLMVRVSGELDVILVWAKK